MEARAVAKYQRISTRKADQILRLIRGLPVDEAEVVLQYTERPFARQVSKILKSAVSNMTQKDEDVTVESLVVREAVAGAAPTLKKIMPRARGRATRIFRRYAHIRIVVSPDEKLEAERSGQSGKTSRRAKTARGAKTSKRGKKRS
ncbi:MAG: 50S ribosomal protein L22 [Candidatus Eisenbacteria bacterium]|nr:50S ribosomal protein L22 [Candidatus Eisenbacteria bacterium]